MEAKFSEQYVLLCFSTTSKMEKLDRYLADAYKKLNTMEEGKVTIAGGGEGVSKKKVIFIFLKMVLFC